MDVVGLLNGISGVVGVPCALVLSWLIFEVRTMKGRLDELEKAREADKKEHATEIGKIYDLCRTMAADLAYIRGRVEGKD